MSEDTKVFVRVSTLVFAIPIHEHRFFILVESALLGGTFRCLGCSPRFVADEREVPEKNIYAPGVYVFTNDLLPWPEGKICTDRSLKIPEFNEGYRCVGITDKRSAGDQS